MPVPPDSVAADLAACRQLLRQHARSFHAASLLLPRRVREPASVLYGFCRLADDAVDVHGGRGDAIALLRQRLDRAYADRPLPTAADRALAWVLQAHAMPRALPEQLLEGLAWDAEGRRYETLDELLHYAARVAGSVGAMMAVLMGARSPAALARACDLGVAMQLTNIARDVGEDARMGRLYLPRQWLRQAGMAPNAWLAAPTHSAALAGVVERLLQEADDLYGRAEAGINLLPADCRPGIRAAARLYAAIGHQVRRQGCNAVQRRAAVPPLRKAWLLACAAWPGPWLRAPRHAQVLQVPPLPATRPLVVAAVRPEPPPAPVRRGTDIVLGLFERLERRDRQQGGAALAMARGTATPARTQQAG